MCGRYSLNEDKQDLEDWFDAVVKGFDEFGPNYNVAPTRNMPVVGQNREGQRTIRLFRWGLLPFWAKEKKLAIA